MFFSNLCGNCIYGRFLPGRQQHFSFLWSAVFYSALDSSGQKGVAGRLEPSRLPVGTGGAAGESNAVFAAGQI